MNRLIKFENWNNSLDILLIVDVQKSFSEYFNDIYLHKLKSYCKKFDSVYQLWDNHIEGKNVNKDYLYEKSPELVKNSDLYQFPNQIDVIEKRYNYNVNVDFYKKELEENVYLKIKKMEEAGSLKKGDFFRTKLGTIIVFIGNNHKWFHVPKKLYELLNSLKKLQKKDSYNFIIVGGARNECLEDVIVTCDSLGVKYKIDFRYTYSVGHFYN